MTARTRRLLLAYALVSVALYACILPLWAGWDEPFHYGYVETLAVQHELPRFGQTNLSEEISQSLERTPLPPFLAQAVPRSVSLPAWHHLAPVEQTNLRALLAGIDPQFRKSVGPHPNYEAHQAPLAYALFASVDPLLARLHLTARVLTLRLLFAFASMFLVFRGVLRLAKALGLKGPYCDTLVFCSLSVQVLWASLAHVGNDMVAIPLTLWFLVLLAEQAALEKLALLLAAGLVTKAYFLCFVPLFAAVCIARGRHKQKDWPLFARAVAIVLVIAGPWYLRNLLRGSLSGTQESMHGVTFTQVLAALPGMNWFRITLVFLRNSLWLGDWSATPFSRGPVTALLLLAAIAAVLYAVQWKRVRPVEGWLWAAVACFAAALVYQTAATRVHTNGHTLAVDPWYWQGVLLAVWALLFRGLQRWRRFGSTVALACIVLTAGVAAYTFVGVLLPEYGAGLARATFAAKLHWWNTTAFADLSRVCIAPIPAISLLLGAFLGLWASALFALARTWKSSWPR